MSDPFEWIKEVAEARREKGLQRTLATIEASTETTITRGGRTLINFSSNDYLGLAHDERLVAAAHAAAQRFGWGAGASPLVSGWSEAHEELAEALARFEGAEAVALFSSGYAANLGTIQSLVGTGDAVYVDKLNHACLVDGAKLAGATIRVFRHNDVEYLTATLARDQGRYRRSLIAVDGVYSMDGDLAPIPALAAVARQFRAMLLVDEAHGTGVFGPDGRGACSEFNACDQVPVRVGTLSKALGSVGGFVAGSRELIDHIINTAKPWMFSTSLPPACAAAAREALRIVETEPERRERVRRVGRELAEKLASRGMEVPAVNGPIVPLIVGDPDTSLKAARRLEQTGFLVPAIRPPTVPDGTSRLRISLSAAHSDEGIMGLSRVLPAAVNK